MLDERGGSFSFLLVKKRKTKKNKRIKKKKKMKEQSQWLSSKARHRQKLGLSKMLCNIGTFSMLRFQTSRATEALALWEI